MSMNSVSVSWRKDRQCWEVKYYLNGQRTRPLFREKPEADSFARKIRLGLAPEDRESITIDEAGKKYFADISKRQSKGSIRNAKRYINLHFHFMHYERGIERLASVILEDMEAFRDWLLALTSEPWPIAGTESDPKYEPMKMGPSTVNRCLAVIKHFYIQHIRWKSITETPCVYLQFLSSEEKPRKATTGEQYLAALEMVEEIWFKPIMVFIYLAGAPASCLERLKWTDVDFVKRTFAMFRKKGKEAKWKRITLNMTDQVFDLFVILREMWPGVQGAVFRDGDGRPLLADRIGKLGSKAFRDAGFEDLTLYSMRHALASDMTESNIALELIRVALGHSSISTTAKYANKIGSKAVVVAIDIVRPQKSGGSLVATAANQTAHLKEIK